MAKIIRCIEDEQGNRAMLGDIVLIKQYYVSMGTGEFKGVLANIFDDGRVAIKQIPNSKGYDYLNSGLTIMHVDNIAKIKVIKRHM